jgi:hypothetical protein
MAQKGNMIDLEEISELTMAGEGAQQGAIPAEGAEQRTRGAMRWTSAMSSFVLRRICQLIEIGVRTDKGFKEVHLNQVAKYLQEFTGMEVSGQQVYNHLRKWRQRWMRVSKLMELSGALWVEDACMISLDDEHYLGHIKVCDCLSLYCNTSIHLIVFYTLC